MEFSTPEWNWEFYYRKKAQEMTEKIEKYFDFFFFFSVLGKKREAFMVHLDRTVLAWTDMCDKRYHCFHFRLFVRFVY